MAKSLVLVKAKKENIFTQIQMIYDMTKKLSDKDVQQRFLIYAKSANKLRQEFSETLDLYHELELAADESYVPNYAPLNSVDELCNYIQANLNVIESKIQARQKTTTEPTAINLKAMPKLPKLEIGEFDGSPEKWPVFYQMFNKLIHENESLSDLEKITYLVSHLQGSAKSICTGVLPTAENYKTLFDSLVKRYDDKRQLASTYLSKILDFRPISNESEKSLNVFLENFGESVTALKQLRLNDLTDFVFVHIALKKLDSETARQFEMTHRSEEIPTFSKLVDFLREQAKILSRTKKAIFVPSKPTYVPNPSRSSHSFIAQNPKNTQSTDSSSKGKNVKLTNLCILCNKSNHQLYCCPSFHNKNVDDRWLAVKKYNACFNCLSINSHRAPECESKNCCSTCSRRHHTLLHRTETPLRKETPHYSSQKTAKTLDVIPHRETASAQDASTQKICSSSLTIGTPTNMVMLATATVKVYDAQGNLQTLRALIDNGSQSHLISPNCCKMLGLKESTFNSVVKGLGSGILQPKTCVTLTFSSSLDSKHCFTINALVTSFLDDYLPTVPVPLDNLIHLQHLPLADENFHIPDKIDLLIGAALWPSIMKSNKVYGPKGTPAAIETYLGYIVMGEMELETDAHQRTFFATLQEPQEHRLDHLVQRFWALEDIPTKRILNAEEKQCEDFFLQTCRRDINGKFSVALPFKQSPAQLGSSKDACISKYISQEKRLLQNPDIHHLYSSVMQEYLMKNYMSWVSDIKSASPNAHYLSHHGVYKPESTSTPLRVVFNGSAPTSNSKTLNELLHVGPKLYPEILDILLNFRLFEYAVSADVSKMYLQIEVQPEYRKYQRLIWRPSAEVDMQIYELNTVVFGLASSPYLAQRVIRLLAEKEHSKFPIASAIVLRDIYMDDLVTSVKEEESVIEVYKQLQGIFEAGSFTLAKWKSNSKELMEIIPDTLKENKQFHLNKEEATKVLGVQWLPQNDSLIFKIATPEDRCSKRSILSVIARTFDLLGLLAPVLVTAKIMIQELWNLHIDWDEIPPPHIVNQWKVFCEELPLLSTLEFPRHIGIKADSVTSLIGFADASEKAYGASVYVRICDSEGSVQVLLLCAKSRVAPLKIKSIPRLELCAALLLAKLMRHIIDLYNDRHLFNQIIAFSDSTVTLHWIKSNPIRWKVFIANRISQIQENLDPTCWKHVSGKENPSDCLSRGLKISALLNHTLWFHGPSWLKLPEEYWPSSVPATLNFEDFKEEQKLLTTIATTHNTDFVLNPLLERVSTYRKLLKTTAYVLRFIQNKPIKNDCITLTEMNKAEELWIKAIQKRYFYDTIQALQDNRLPQKNIRHLNPFIENGLLRVGGRLEYADLPQNQKHPILLPKNHRFVDLLIDHYHQENLHTGPHLVMSLLNLKYWIISARNQIRKRLRACNTCFKANPRPVYPKMAPLPQLRIQPQQKAFANTGVDYAGPYTITLAKRRGAKTQKAYICLFVCLAVKAIHIELVTELTTNAFMNAFKRFLSRRGPVRVLMSDCGTNFIGAKNHLDELNKFIVSRDFQSNIRSQLSNRQIDWKFNPPSSPHFGGLWESNVKSVKTHLKRVIGQQILTYEEMNTLLIQVEALLNSRPLCVLSNDPNAPTALTPAHFLTLGPTLDSLPAQDVTNVPLNRLTRYQLIDNLLQSFWKRWNLEYLQTLQIRKRWNLPSQPIAKDSIIILKKENTSPLDWPLGIIVDTFPGKDGIIRVVDVRTQGGTFRRPVTKICPLPEQ